MGQRSVDVGSELQWPDPVPAGGAAVGLTRVWDATSVESVDTLAGTALTPNGGTSAPQAPGVPEILEMTVEDDQDSKQKRTKQLTRKFVKTLEATSSDSRNVA